MTPLEASKKIKERLVYNNLKDKREIQKPNFILGDLVRTSDIKNVFSNGDCSNYSYQLYAITEVIHDMSLLMN